ncbi:MAG: hypothetical protein INH43_15390 [Acidobacteriaceae bacterium]|nr:hypothetical protein [Acidobacteriaceae bacterium]
MKPYAPVPLRPAFDRPSQANRSQAGDQLPISLRTLSPRYREAILSLYHEHRQRLDAQGELECNCVASIAWALYRHQQITAIKTSLERYFPPGSPRNFATLSSEGRQLLGCPNDRKLQKFLKSLDASQKAYRQISQEAERNLRSVRKLLNGRV